MTTINNLCRICLTPEKTEDNYVLVFTKNSKIALKIFMISGIQVCFKSFCCLFTCQSDFFFPLGRKT